MKDFLCERCTYYLDNNVEEIDEIRCRFCEEIKGIFIFCDKKE
jgi:hypothetical protein